MGFPEEGMVNAKEVRTIVPVTQQEKALAELHDTIEVLAQRLKPVLTPVPKVDGNSTGEDKAAPSQSPLTEQLNNNNYSIRKANEKLSALMECLEV